MLICSITLWSPGVKAGCGSSFGASGYCTVCGECCSSSTSGSCGVGNTYGYCASACSTYSSYPTYEEEEEEFEEAAAAAAGATVLAAAAAAPPPLPMMAPQGLPQPGSVAAGGGVLPATALAVS